MFKMMFSLQWKEFNRGKAVGGKLVAKILKWFGIIYFAFMAFMMGIIASAYGGPLAEFPLEDGTTASFLYVNKQLIYVFVYLIVMRYFVQSLPVLNIKALLLTPLLKIKIVRFSLLKTVLTYFNILPLFFLIPFSFLLASTGDYDIVGLIFWNINIIGLIYVTNFFNFLLNNKDKLLYGVGGILALIKILEYYSIVDFTEYSEQFFYLFYSQPYAVAFTWLLVFWLYNYVNKYLLQGLYIDTGLQVKTKEAKMEDFSFLDRFGKTATFIKNDLRLLKRSKRARTAVYMGIGMLFYGIIFVPSEEILGSGFLFFGYLFSTGGFLFMFGSFVPSWDSQYYPLMMTQNIEYKEYLNSKWSLMIIGTVISTVLASFIYSFFGVNAVYAVLAGAFYNIGVNGYLTLWAGAYTKSPIDLNSSANAFGDKKAFNAKTMLVGIPQMLLPVLVYYFTSQYYDHFTGCLAVAVLGTLGILLKPIAFNLILKAYKTEKYSTLKAYKTN
ncbi:DUF5687 family protein [Flavobacteriaceae bacterium]|jgi:hypothetical protein|nr:DUF5687 family protein [Flavobacteriaceae bacterium]|tara:strand:+ start:3750 stop:5240 length:1491 start_codon:yes stop_codon:yes gene_type:complete